MSGIRNGRLELYCAKYVKCNHMITLGSKGFSIDGMAVNYVFPMKLRESQILKVWGTLSVQSNVHT